MIQKAGRIAAHRKPPSNLTAYELYLLGTEKLEQINRADVEEAIKLLKRAVELDPGLARAWVELYHSYSVMTGFGADFEDNLKLAAEAAERAVMLDPSDAEAHAVLGWSFGDRNDLARAKAEFDTALRMAPNQFEILAFYACWASTFGAVLRWPIRQSALTRTTRCGVRGFLPLRISWPDAMKTRFACRTA